MQSGKMSDFIQMSRVPAATGWSIGNIVMLSFSLDADQDSKNPTSFAITPVSNLKGSIPVLLIVI